MIHLDCLGDRISIQFCHYSCGEGCVNSNTLKIEDTPSLSASCIRISPSTHTCCTVCSTIRCVKFEFLPILRVIVVEVMEDVDVQPSMFKSVGIFRALEYLDSLQKPDARTPVILEWLAEDLHDHKEMMAKQLGKMKNFRQIIMSVLGLMIKGDKRLEA